MLPWMVYVIVVTLALSAAAWSAEHALRLRRSGTRWVWAGAIIASLIVPTFIASVSVQLPNIDGSLTPQKTIALRATTSLPITALTNLPMLRPHIKVGESLDSKVKRYWLITSVILALLLAASAAQLFWRKRRWERSTLGGVPVYIAPGVGPAVVGLLRSRIVVPPWVVELPPEQQSHVLAHEQSHLTAYDPQLLTAAICLLVFMPWNLPLWWQLLRLRRAIEVDCDTRVLKAGHQANHYGETLLAVGQRQSKFIGAVAAMSESRSFLEQRIQIMLSKRSRGWKLSAVLLGCAAVSLVAVAAQVSPPNSQTTEESFANRPVVTVDPVIYDGYVGHYRFGGFSMITATREGNSLFLRLTSQPTAEVFPSSKTEFFYKIVNAQVTFETDAQGRATALVLHQNGRDQRAQRIDEQTAAQLESQLNERMKSQTPQPGSEDALRRLFNGLLANNPNYSEMSPRLEEVTRKQLPRLAVSAKHFGAIQSMEFRGVGQQGWDVYDVRHENGMSSTWRISLAPDGKIDGALFTAGP